MTNANYIPYDGNHSFSGEIVFSTDEWTHMMVEGTDTIAVVPTIDVYPA
jgi:hypothetical protein